VSSFASALGLTGLARPVRLTKRVSLWAVERLAGLLSELKGMPLLARLREPRVVGTRSGVAALSFDSARLFADFLHRHPPITIKAFVGSQNRARRRRPRARASFASGVTGATLSARVAQCGAERLLHDGMVDGHRKHRADGELLLMSPSQKMTEMLGARSDDLGSKEAARNRVGVDMAETAIAPHDPAPPLVLEVHLAHDDLALLRKRLEARADHSELWLRSRTASNTEGTDADEPVAMTTARASID